MIIKIVLNRVSEIKFLRQIKEMIKHYNFIWQYEITLPDLHSSDMRHKPSHTVNDVSASSGISSL